MQSFCSSPHLSAELLLIVFGHLQTQDLLVIAATSHHFRALAQCLPNYIAAFSLYIDGDDYTALYCVERFASRAHTAHLYSVPITVDIFVASPDLDDQRTIWYSKFDSLIEDIAHALDLLIPRAIEVLILLPYKYSQYVICTSLTTPAPLLREFHLTFLERDEQEKLSENDLSDIFSAQAPSLANVSLTAVYAQRRVPAFENVCSVTYNT